MIARQVHGRHGQERVRRMAVICFPCQAHRTGRVNDDIISRLDDVRRPPAPLSHHSAHVYATFMNVRYQFVAYAWLVVPTLDTSEKYTTFDCVLTEMVNIRFCTTVRRRARAALSHFFAPSRQHTAGVRHPIWHFVSHHWSLHGTL